jgi:PilZ domain
MEAQKYCVYNQTRESFLSLGVTIADSSNGNLHELAERLTSRTDSGFWIMPFRRLPRLTGIPPIDLVYLDSEYRVVHEIESFPTSAVESLTDDAASALILPVHTIYSSQTQTGDQLVICVADEMERRLEKLSTSFIPAPNPTNVVSSNEKQPEDNFEELDALGIRSAKEETMFQGSETMNSFEPRTGRPNTLKMWLTNWLSSDRRRAPRQPLPGLVAYYWTGSAPRAYQIADISSSGFYLLTEERWFPGTMVLMTLQRTDSSGRNLDDSIAVQSRVVRWGSDGLGLAFVLSTGGEPSVRENGADKKTLERFLGRLKDSSAVLKTVSR